LSSATGFDFSSLSASSELTEKMLGLWRVDVAAKFLSTVVGVGVGAAVHGFLRIKLGRVRLGFENLSKGFGEKRNFLAGNWQHSQSIVIVNSIDPRLFGGAVTSPSLNSFHFRYNLLHTVINTMYTFLLLNLFI
jgi:hypothetical protein